jgi:hypothetical protein
MEDWVRQCERCHHVDFAERWPSLSEAEAGIAVDDAWRCEQCGFDRADAVLASGVGGG